MQLYKLDKSQSTYTGGDKLNQSENKTVYMILIEPTDLVGRTFILDTKDGENKLRTQIVEEI